MHICENCLEHGFPCVNCAEIVFLGELGPGFVEGRRAIILEGLAQDIHDRMVNWMNTNNVPCYVFRDTNHLVEFLLDEEGNWPEIPEQVEPLGEGGYIGPREGGGARAN